MLLMVGPTTEELKHPTPVILVDVKALAETVGRHDTIGRLHFLGGRIGLRRHLVGDFVYSWGHISPG
jgi:hypothetical protein